MVNYYLGGGQFKPVVETLIEENNDILVIRLDADIEEGTVCFVEPNLSGKFGG